MKFSTKKALLNKCINALVLGLILLTIIEIANVGIVNAQSAVIIFDHPILKLESEILENTSAEFNEVDVSIHAPNALGKVEIELFDKKIQTRNLQSINKVVGIHPEVNQQLNASLTFQYQEAELDELEEEHLILYSSNDNGLTWNAHPNSIVDTKNNSIHLDGIEHFSLWTAGPAAAMDPCQSCATATCTAAPITDQINVFYNVDGFQPDAECHSGISATVVDGQTVTFCATYTTPAVLEENFMSFLGSVPIANAGCDATNIDNWQLTSSCNPVTPASFVTTDPNLPAGVPRPIWPITANTTYELCYDVTVSGLCSQISQPCFAPHWAPVPCDLILGSSSSDCSDNDGNFDISIPFSNGGQGAGTYIITNDLGTLAGDDPNLLVSGTIIINDIPDGSSYLIEVTGDGVNSGCYYTIQSTGYTCSFCPKITSATVEQDDCEGNTVTLATTVDQGVEGQDFYIQWFLNGTAINTNGASSVGMDGVYGTADDPISALTYSHTLAFDGGVAGCSFQDQVYTAKLFCKTSDTFNQGNSALGGTQAGGGVTVIATYDAINETCVGLDLSALPAGVIAESFDYQFRVSSGFPFGFSWICEAVVNIKTPSATEGPFCHSYWATNGGCPTVPAGPQNGNNGDNATTCFSGPGNGNGTNLIPNSISNSNLGGIYSTTAANGVWEICVYDSWNDENGAVEGVMNYGYLKVNYFLPPGLDVNFADYSIVDAINITSPSPIASAPVTTANNPNGAGLVTGLRVCNAPVEGVDFTLPNFSNCETEITTVCPGAVVRYSNDNGNSYLLLSPAGIPSDGQVVYYNVTTLDCANSCGGTGTYTLSSCAEVCGNGVDNDGDGDIDCDDTDCNPWITQVIAIDPTLATCPDLNDGSIAVYVSGNDVEYSIDGGGSWSIENVFNGLDDSQSYIVRVRNTVLGCEAAYSGNPVTLTDPVCEEICDNGIDDDGDTFVDCLDHDCHDDPTLADSDNDGVPDCIDLCNEDRDGDGINDCADIDPMGWIYYEHTGEIVTGAYITVVNSMTNSSADVVYLDRGQNGFYRWIVNAPGVYEMTITAPPGYQFSSNCSPLDPPAYDPTGQADPVVLGNDQVATSGFLSSGNCTPFYMTFDLEIGDPFIIFNNIPVIPLTEIYCNDGIDNDGDGLIDCDDPDCTSDPNCCDTPALSIDNN